MAVDDELRTEITDLKKRIAAFEAKDRQDRQIDQSFSRIFNLYGIATDETINLRQDALKWLLEMYAKREIIGPGIGLISKMLSFDEPNIDEMLAQLRKQTKSQGQRFSIVIGAVKVFLWTMFTIIATALSERFVSGNK